jgi:hypothetical protein
VRGYRPVMAAAGSEEHRERAQRAQQLRDRAREQGGLERSVAERCEQSVANGTEPGLNVHRQAAELHRQALHQYEETARLQQHADHEQGAAERVLAMETAGGDLRATADRRDIAADERDRLADVREAAADERDGHAGRRERLQDERERRQDLRERRFDEATGRWTPRQRDQLAQAKSALRRVEARLARDDAALHRDDARVGRDQATIDRESAATARSEPPPRKRPSDEPGEAST